MALNTTLPSVDVPFCHNTICTFCKRWKTEHVTDWISAAWCNIYTTRSLCEPIFPIIIRYFIDISIFSDKNSSVWHWCIDQHEPRDASVTQHAPSSPLNKNWVFFLRFITHHTECSWQWNMELSIKRLILLAKFSFSLNLDTSLLILLAELQKERTILQMHVYINCTNRLHFAWR